MGLHEVYCIYCIHCDNMLSNSERKHNTLTCDTCSYLAIWQRKKIFPKTSFEPARLASNACLLGGLFLAQHCQISETKVSANSEQKIGQHCIQYIFTVYVYKKQLDFALPACVDRCFFTLETAQALAKG